MQQPSAQMATHAVDWRVVNGDVVLYQMLFVVQMVFIVARMAAPVHRHHVRKGLI